MVDHARTAPSGALAGGGGAWWNDRRIRGIVAQVAAVAVVAAIIGFFWHNALVNMARQGIATGFAFLSHEASFEISSALIEYSPASTYARALTVGLLNTLLVAAIGCVLSTILGTIVGIARLSGNWLLRQISLWYVEVMRNTPLLLQLIVWWDMLRVSAPLPRDAWQILPDVYVSNRGLALPVPVWHGAYYGVIAAFLIGIAATMVVARWARRRQERTGQQFHTVWTGIALIVGLPLLTFLAAGAPLELDIPQRGPFNFSGGDSVSTEFAALVIGLVAYTSAFVAETVRGGIQSVSWGQSEAAGALGLKRGLALRLVVLPQAFRVIIPPVTSEYLSLAKNSSLAVYIGFPDLASIADTSLNQTGQAVEVIGLMMAVYLTISLAISAVMNLYNRMMALVER